VFYCDICLGSYLRFNFLETQNFCKTLSLNHQVLGYGTIPDEGNRTDFLKSVHRKTRNEIGVDNGGNRFSCNIFRHHET